MPDKVGSSIGTLELLCGYTQAGAFEKIYGKLDSSRDLQAYLMAAEVIDPDQGCHARK